MSESLNREALSLIADELEMQGSQLSTAIAKLDTLNTTMGRIESLLVQTLEGHARADDDQARRRIANNERFERIERALKLRTASGT